MRTIWKFPLAIADQQHIAMPRGARPKFVAVQDGQIHLWALVNSAAPMVKYVIRIRGTGHEVYVIDDANQGYIGSVIMANGALVWHVFDGGEA